MAGAVIIEIVKAGLTAGLTLLAAWLQKRKDLRDLRSGRKSIEDLER